MSQSTHQFQIKGVDKSGAAFASIKSRASATGAQLRQILGGAFAAAGAYLGLRSIKGGIDELGKLSDIAMKTSTSVSELTKTATAFSVLGIQNMGVDQLARAFDYLQRSTGRSGLEGFIQTVEEIGRIDDAAQRSEMAVKVFGRSGLELLPLINAADNGAQSLRDLISVMPGVSDAAAAAGDDAADAITIVTRKAKSLWLEAIGKVCSLISDDFAASARQGAVEASVWMDYFAHNAVDIVGSAWRRITGVSSATWAALKAWFSTSFKEGATWADVFRDTAAAWKGELEEMDDDLESFENRFDERAKKLAESLEKARRAQAAYESAAGSTADREKRDRAREEAVGARLPAIRNELMMAGSNAVMRAAIIGPQLQSETRKQTSILEQIAENTKSTAENTEEANKDSYKPL